MTSSVSDSASRYFASEFSSISSVVLKRLELEWRYHRRPDLAQADQQLLQYALEFGRLLDVVYRHSLFSGLLEESKWYARVFAARGSGHDAFGLVLDSWLIAIQGVIKPPECNELARPLQAIRGDLASMIEQAQHRSQVTLGPGGLLLVETIVRGDVRGAQKIILDMVAQGTPPDGLIVDVMLPAMAEIGRRWEFNELEVFQEHLATETIQSLLAGLPLMRTGPLPKQNSIALVSCAPRDEHALIPLALAAYLSFKGWTVRNLGVSLPSDQIARAVQAMSPHALFLTLTLLSGLNEALEVIEKCRPVSADCRIILGGRGALAAKTILEDRGAWVARDFDEGFRKAAESIDNA